MSFNKFTFYFFVIIPSIIVTIYYYKYASDQYVSESRYIIQGNNQQSVDVLGMVTGLTGTSASASDALTVQNYVYSHDFVSKIQTKFNLEDTYSNENYDWWARLSNSPSAEELLDYWESSVVQLSFDPASGISTLEVTAFEPDIAKEISSEILSISESFVNDISQEARGDAVFLANTEVINAKLDLDNLREQIATFSEEENVISVEQNAQTEQGIVAELKQRLALTESEYKQLSAIMRPETLKVKALLNEIQSLRQQINVQQQRWKRQETGPGKTVVSAVQNTARLSSELVFAEQLYINALSAKKQAEIETKQKQRYLEKIVPPHLPEDAVKPERLVLSLSFLLASFMIWGVLSLMISSVREHLGWT